ncbi:MAG: divalent-cation tolerance protein CutA [Candidatus Woesearchaeota archaeon]
MISVYITCKDEKEAESIVKHLLQLRLIACANLFPVRSLYWWKDKIQDEKEVAIIAKATDEKFAAIVDEVKHLHSYEVPCIVALPWKDSNPEYGQWVENET